MQTLAQLDFAIDSSLARVLSGTGRPFAAATRSRISTARLTAGAGPFGDRFPLPRAAPDWSVEVNGVHLLEQSLAIKQATCILREQLSHTHRLLRAERGRVWADENFRVTP